MEPVAVHNQALAGTAIAARHDDLGGSVGVRGAGRVQYRGCGVARQHPLSLDEPEGRQRTQQQVGWLVAGLGVGVGEEPPEPRAAQLVGGDESGRDGP
ncbi:MAG TPA: hypothetical protein VGE11_13640 [Pseudonocardia sp.]